LTVDVRRDIDVEYMKRAKAFMGRSVGAGNRSSCTSTTR
jgi:hypothetical protein